MRRFPDPHLVLSAPAHRDLLVRLRSAQILGGGVYDGLVAETARSHDATLLSLDARAARVYDRLGARFELIA
jgi:predicted nucleic acid-binding protein